MVPALRGRKVHGAAHVRVRGVHEDALPQQELHLRPTRARHDFKDVHLFVYVDFYF